MAKTNLKVPPQSIDAEKSVVGSLLLDKDAIITVVDILTPDDFYKEAHGIIYESVLQLYEKRMPVDVVTLTDQLEKEGKLEAAGGASYLTNLVNFVPSATRVVHYANIVQQKATLRRLIQAASRTLDLGYQEEKDMEIILDEAEKNKNYAEKFYGPTLFRTALVQSRNVVTVKILNKIGIHYIIEYARKMGIESDLAPDLSLALGSSGVSLKELTRAYGIFASGGLLAEPLFITRVEDRFGKVLEENNPSLKEVLSKQTSYIMTDILKAVVQEGTGYKAKVLKRPVAGKTGTTNDLRDAWFVGFSPDLVAGVWVGYDDRRSMTKGETGASAASPIWVNFMSEILKNKPIQDFPIPAGVVFAKIDDTTGLLASPTSEKTIFQAFREGEEPTTYSPAPKSADSKSFIEFDLNNQE